MGKLDGKVALITGAARGQGRSHAIRLAEEGADIIAVDIASQIESVPYPLATPEDLEETVREVEKHDRRIIARQGDVRDVVAMRRIVDEGVAELGDIDIVLANAGIIHQGAVGRDPDRVFRDVIDVNLIGVWNTVSIVAPRMIERDQGGAIVLTSSTQGFSGRGGTAGRPVPATLRRSTAWSGSCARSPPGSVRTTSGSTPCIRPVSRPA